MGLSSRPFLKRQITILAAEGSRTALLRDAADPVTTAALHGLRLCQRAGLVKLGHVAVDGTKLKANASRHKAMSYQRMLSEEPKLAAEVKGVPG